MDCSGCVTLTDSTTDERKKYFCAVGATYPGMSWGHNIYSLKRSLGSSYHAIANLYAYTTVNIELYQFSRYLTCMFAGL